MGAWNDGCNDCCKKNDKVEYEVRTPQLCSFSRKLHEFCSMLLKNGSLLRFPWQKREKVMCKALSLFWFSFYFKVNFWRWNRNCLQGILAGLFTTLWIEKSNVRSLGGSGRSACCFASQWASSTVCSASSAFQAWCRIRMWEMIKISRCYDVTPVEDPIWAMSVRLGGVDELSLESSVCATSKKSNLY